MLEEYYVYIWQNSQDGHAYIGKGKGNRARTHVNRSLVTDECPRFYRAVRKYGWEYFTLRLLAVGLSHAEAVEIEQDAIAEYRPLVYNLTDGGEGAPGVQPSQETKRKMHEAHKYCSSERKQEQRDHAARIRQLAAAGQRTTSGRANIAKAQLGKTVPTSVRAKMSATHKARAVFSLSAPQQMNAKFLYTLGASKLQISKWLEVSHGTVDRAIRRTNP